MGGVTEVLGARMRKKIRGWWIPGLQENAAFGLASGPVLVLEEVGGSVEVEEFAAPL